MNPWTSVMKPALTLLVKLKYPHSLYVEFPCFITLALTFYFFLTTYLCCTNSYHKTLLSSWQKWRQQIYSFAKSVAEFNIFEINIVFNDSNWGLKFTFYYYIVRWIYQLLYNFNIYRSCEGSRFLKREEPAKFFSWTVHTWKEIELHFKNRKIEKMLLGQKIMKDFL